MAEFTENANESAEIEHSSFFMNFEYELRMKFDMMRIFNSQSVRERIDQERIQMMLRRIKQI